MVDMHQFSVLSKGVIEWNYWRMKCPEIRVDFSQVNLPMAHLRMAYLDNANMSRANMPMAHLRLSRLKMANLSGANLREADLSYANLSGANLRGANLHGANMKRTNLLGADLYGANLENADLSEAILLHTNMEQVTIGSTKFSNLDLSRTMGLMSIIHKAPSIIDVHSLNLSEGRIPSQFLKNIGLPEAFVEQVPALYGALNPIGFYSCFICHSTSDIEFVTRLRNSLAEKGLKSFLAYEDFDIGENLRHGIDKAIQMYDKFVLVLSEHSVRSHWVEHEVETALELERESGRDKTMILPLRLDNTIEAYKTGWQADIKRRFISNFTEWQVDLEYKKQLRRLLEALQRKN